MVNELISVIVPIYNVEKYIERCVKSIINQTYTNLEIILVDDGSTDDSSDICDQFIDKRIKVIHKDNGGLGSARNAGLDAASGKYVTFVDGDDEIAGNHIENLYRLIALEKCDTCLCGHTKVYPNSRIENENYLKKHCFEGQEILKKVLSRMMGSEPGKYDKIEMSVCMALYSNEIIQANGIRFVSEREFISEDLIFDFDYYPNCQRIVVSEDVGYYYYDNIGSLTTRYNPNRFELQKKMTQEEIRRAKALSIYEESRYRIYSTFMGITRYSIKLEQKFAQENGMEMAKNNIKTICCDPMIKEALAELKGKDVPWKSKIINYMIGHNLVFLLMQTMKMKNKYGI